MPKIAKRHRKSFKQELGGLHRYCTYCQRNRDRRGFDKHQAACKIIWQIRHRQEGSKRLRSMENRNEELTQVQKIAAPYESDPIEVSSLSLLSFARY